MRPTDQCLWSKPLKDTFLNIPKQPILALTFYTEGGILVCFISWCLYTHCDNFCRKRCFHQLWKKCVFYVLIHPCLECAIMKSNHWVSFLTLQLEHHLLSTQCWCFVLLWGSKALWHIALPALPTLAPGGHSVAGDNIYCAHQAEKILLLSFLTLQLPCFSVHLVTHLQAFPQGQDIP